MAKESLLHPRDSPIVNITSPIHTKFYGTHPTPRSTNMTPLVQYNYKECPYIENTLNKETPSRNVSIRIYCRILCHQFTSQKPWSNGTDSNLGSR